MNVLVAKSWEGDREGDPERRIIILPNLGRGGSVDEGAMPWAAFPGLGRGSAKGDTSQGSVTRDPEKQAEDWRVIPLDACISCTFTTVPSFRACRGERAPQVLFN